MTSMKHARFIAATVLAALLLAGCTGRRSRRRRRQGFRRRHVRNRSFHAGPDRRGDAGRGEVSARRIPYLDRPRRQQQTVGTLRGRTTRRFSSSTSTLSAATRTAIRSFIRKGPQAERHSPILQAFRRRTSRHGRDFTDLLHTLKKRRPGAACTPCGAGRTSAQLDAGPLFPGSLLRKLFQSPTGVDFGFAFRPSDNGRPAALTHQRGGTHRPDALPPPDNGRRRRHRPGGHIPRGHRVQDGCVRLQQ